MSIINIRGLTAVDDPEYRYRMPSIMGKVEGRGNGIKTVIPNVCEVASSLHRDPAEVTKFFGCELGSQTTFNEENGRAVVNGSHTTPDLQNNLFKYIDKFVLCPNCRLPETIYKVKNGDIFSICAACGAKEALDLTHKLTVFILAQDKRRKKEKKDKKNKEEKKKDKKSKGDDDDEDDGKKKKKDKKEKKEKKDKKKKKDKKEVEEDDDENDDDENGSEKSDEGAAAEKSGSEDENDDDEDEEVNAIADEVADATLTDMTEGMTAKETAVSTMMKYLSEEGKSASPNDVVEYLKKLQVDSTLLLKECAYIYVGAVFNENIIKSSQIKANSQVLQALVATDANKFMARHIIGAIEDFFGSKYPQLAKAFPLALKQFYDEDILEEDVILDWAKQGVTYEFSPQSMTGDQIRDLRSSAEPFITWLNEADEDDDEE